MVHDGVLIGVHITVKQGQLKDTLYMFVNYRRAKRSDTSVKENKRNSADCSTSFATSRRIISPCKAKKLM